MLMFQQKKTILVCKIKKKHTQRETERRKSQKSDRKTERRKEEKMLKLYTIEAVLII